jgi:dolichol kinase
MTTSPPGLSDEIAVVRMRPMNLPRSFFHVGSGISIVLASVLFEQRTLLVIAAVFAGLGWLLEGTRRIWPAWNSVLMRLFRPVAHSHEAHGVNSATWYVTAWALLLATTHEHAANVGVLALAFGDPVAGVVGRKLGRRKLLANKTLEGSLAFLAATAIVGAAYLAWLGHVAIGPALATAALAGLVGAVAEMLSTRVDDNLSVPLLSGWAAALTLALLHA